MALPVTEHAHLRISQLISVLVKLSQKSQMLSYFCGDCYPFEDIVIFLLRMLSVCGYTDDTQMTQIQCGDIR